MELTITRQIEPEILANSFVGIVECNHMTRAWVDGISVSNDVASKYDIWYADPAFWESDYKITVIHDGPASPHEGANDCKTVLTPKKVKSGLELMAVEAPKHFADLIAEEGDAITADVMFQYIVLRKLVFG